MKESEVFPLYEEMRSILRELPEITSDKMHTSVRSETIWDGYHNLLDMIGNIVDEDLSRHKISPETGRNYKYIKVLALRQKVSGAIVYIGSKYLGQMFEDGKDGGIIVNQVQSQTQELSVEIKLDIQERVIKKLSENELEKEERGFLEKLKSSISQYSSYTSLISSLFKLMKEFGITPEFIIELLS